MEKSAECHSKAHALLGASSAHRWLRCTPSAVAESAVEDEGSDFAREGSLAHAMAARELKRLQGEDTAAEETEIAELYEQFHSGEMDECVADYVEYVTQRLTEARRDTPDAILLIEQRLDYSRWVPEGFGTGDAVIVGEGRMEIIDLKYGKGVAVSAEDNPQMKLYALGALDECESYFQISDVRCTIFQPRLFNVSVWETRTDALKLWADEVVRPLAEVASRGLGARQGGPWCRFCKVKGTCFALARECLELAGKPADVLDTEQLGNFVLPKLETVKIWLKAVEEEALKTALTGEEIPGWKLVEGRSIRKIVNQQELARILAMDGYKKEEIMKEPELRTLTELDKLVGKKHLAELAGNLIDKPQGKPTLVPESDRRQRLDPGGDFAGLSVN